MLEVRRLSLADAGVLIDGAIGASKDIGIDMCIAVTDESGHLIDFKRMDGGKISSISIAIDKAFTAAVARKGTHVYNQLCVPGQPTFGIHITNGGHFSVIGGGLPIVVKEEIVGGIGISSGTAVQDQEVAEAAVSYFYEHTDYRPK
ncbi:MAG: heme-binding protein [Hyphomicrobium sp.]